MTRSNPQGEILDHPLDINTLERELRRARERQRHIERLNMEVPNNGVVLGPQPRPRVIGDFDEPNQREQSLGIIPPVLDEGHIEMKPSTLHMVERNTFKGNAIECPLEHLDRFERLCKTLYMRNVPEETKKMLLFPFSLEDKGSYWERNILSSKVSTWEEVKKEFLSKFYPKQKTARFRNEIQTFAQFGGESMSDAWDRLRRLTRSCPHHGMSQENLLGLFYRGVHNDIRRALDTASNGNFSGLDVESAETLIENLAQSDACFGGDYERNPRKVVANVDEMKDSSETQRELSKELGDKLCEKFEKLGKMFVTCQRQTSQDGQQQAQYQDPSQGFYQEFQEGNSSGGQEISNQEWSGNEQSQEVAFMSNQGGYNNFRPLHPHPNLSYRSPNVENPTSQTNPSQPAQPFQPRPTNFYPNQNPRPNNQYFNPRPQQTNFQPQGFNQRPQGGNFQGYNQPRGNFSNQQWYPQRYPQQSPQGGYNMEEDPNVVVEKLRQAIQGLTEKLALHDKATASRQPGSFPAKPEPNPKPSCSTLTYSGPDGYLEEGVVEDCVDEEVVEEVVEEVAKEEGSFSEFVQKLSVEKESTKVVEALNSPLMSEAIKGHFLVSKLVKDLELNEGACEEIDLPIFEEESKKELSNKEKDALFKARKGLKDLGFHVDKGKGLHQVRAQLNFVKSILANKDKVVELVETYDSAITKSKFLKKTIGKGMFTIPCSLGDHELNDAFCDSGSVVSVISSKMARDFGLEGMEECEGALSFGDQSVKKANGVFKDFPIKVGDTYVPTDLMCLEMEEGRNQALILGVPFMLTAGAKLDYVKNVVSFDHIDKNVFYIIEDKPDFVLTNSAVSPIGSDNDKINILIPTVRIVNQEDIHLVDKLKDVIPSVDELVDVKPEPPTSKKTKKKSKAKKKVVASVEEIKEAPVLPIAIPLIFKPIAFEDGKLVCKVKAPKGATKPFATVRVILDSVDENGNGGSINERMIKTFGMQFGDPGPSLKEGPSPSDH